MRSAGRWNDLGSGSEFSAQGKRECCHILKELGLGGAEADRWSNVLIATENEKKTEFLGSSLLADATTMETVRDFSLNKNIKISMLPFFLHLDQKVSRLEAVLEFTALCCHHAGVIKSQQGTLYLALLDANGSPLKDWPALDKDHSLHAKQVQATQKVFEYDEKCFEKCQQAVNFRGLANNLEMLFKKEPAWHQQPQSQSQSRAEEAEALARAKAKVEAREAEALARSRTEKKESPKNAEDKLAEIMAKIRADKDLRSSPEVIEKADRQAKAEADPFYRVQAYEKNVIESYRKSNRGLAEVTLGLKKNQYTVPDDIPALESMAKELQEMEGMILQGKFNGDYILKKHGFFTVQLHGIFDRVDLRKQALNPTFGKIG